MFFRKNKKYEMDMDAANAALRNIFAACDQAPNTIPFDKLILRQKVNIAVYNRLLLLTGLVLILTFLSPLAIVPAANMMEQIFVPQPVTLIDDYVKDNLLYLQLTGDNVIYKDAYFETPEGQKQYAVSYDIREQIICFPFLQNTELNIYIPIEGDDTLHLLLSPK